MADAQEPLSLSSPDGTRIAYEKVGDGPALILVGGAFSDRRSAASLANELKADFTVVTFDRRGRGDSGNTLPYHVDREIEDVASLVAATRASYLYGHSSGAILALLAAAARLPVSRLATYEPPYAIDKEGNDQNTEMMTTIDRLIAAGNPEATVLYWFEATGMPLRVIDHMRSAPFWPSFLAKAPTLRYELELKVAGGDAEVPSGRLGKISVPLLAMAGSASPEWMRGASKKVASVVPSAEYSELAGQNHMVPDALIAPELRSFFLKA